MFVDYPVVNSVVDSIVNTMVLVNNFSERVYQAVRKIPFGKVATYGQVAASIGHPGAARAVGNVLHYNPFSDVPCHRVVNHQGRVAEHYGKGGYQEQKERLLAEGVKFKDSRRVDLKKHNAILKDISNVKTQSANWRTNPKLKC